MSEVSKNETLKHEATVCLDAIEVADKILHGEKAPGNRGGECGHAAAIVVHNMVNKNGSPTGWTAGSINTWMMQAAARGETRESISSRYEKFIKDLDSDLIPEIYKSFRHALAWAKSPNGNYWLIDPTICQFVNNNLEIGTTKIKTGQTLEDNVTVNELYEKNYVSLSGKSLLEFLKGTSSPKYCESLPETLDVTETIKNTPLIPTHHEIEELTID